jgi:hypothetical protein
MGKYPQRLISGNEDKFQGIEAGCPVVFRFWADIVVNLYHALSPVAIVPDQAW